MIRLEGRVAIDVAEAFGLPLSKYSDPVEDARTLTPAEAREVAREDPRLVYVDVDTLDIAAMMLAVMARDTALVD
jgi:hypothetical protein